MRRNYYKRDPESISDVKMPYTNGKMSKTINPISADASNVTAARENSSILSSKLTFFKERLKTVPEAPEAQEEDTISPTDERWKGVDSSNYDPNATIKPLPPLKTTPQKIAKPPRSISAPERFPDTETKL